MVGTKILHTVRVYIARFGTYTILSHIFMVSRRYSCILLQCFLFLYALGIIGYFARRAIMRSAKTNRTHPEEDGYDSEFAAQPSSYTFGLQDHSQQITIALPPPTNATNRVRAGFIVLVRNSELYGMLSSMRDVGR